MTAEGTGPRLVYRQPSMWAGRAEVAYRTIRLSDLRWVPRHVETYHTLGDARPLKRTRPDAVRIFTPGAVRDVSPAAVGDHVRRPTARALARIEAAEAAIAAAQEELKAARRAAFTYGKPVPVSTIKREGRR